MISLKEWMSSVAQNISAHVGTLIGVGAAHGIAGWGGSPKALGPAAGTGNEATIARGDHVHPTTGLLLTTDRGGTPVALGSAAAEGNATTVARSNHVHPYPTAANVGALPFSNGTVSESVRFSSAMVAAGSFSFAVAPGGNQKQINFGNERASGKYGTSLLVFYTSDDNTADARLFREGNATAGEGDFCVHNMRGAGAIRTQAALLKVQNQAGSGKGALDCGALTATSVTVNGVAVSVSGHTHDYAASSHTHAIAALPTPTSGTPAALGTASHGNAETLSRSDHVHPMPSASDVGAAASSHAHGGVSSSGAIGTTSGLPVITTTSGALTTGSWGGTTSNLGSSASGGSSTNFSRADHVHAYPTAANVGALPIEGGALTGTLALSVSSGERTVNIGTGRTADGNSFLRFYSTNGGSEDAAIYRIGGEDSELRIRQSRGTGGVRFLASAVHVKNAADRAYAPIGASAFNVNSDPRAKQAIRPVGSVPTPRALGAAVIEFRWARGGDGRQHVGFNAAAMREIAPLASVDMLPDPETGETELGVDLVAVMAIQARLIADLADRLDALEARGGRP